MQTTKEMRDRLRELCPGTDDYDRVVLMLLEDFEALIAQPVERTVHGEPVFYDLTSAAIEAIRTGRPVNVSSRPASDRNDAGRHDNHEQRGADQVRDLASEIGRYRAPSVGRAHAGDLIFDPAAFVEQVKWPRNSGSVLGAKASAGPTSAAKDTLGSIDFGGELRG